MIPTSPTPRNRTALLIILLMLTSALPAVAQNQGVTVNYEGKELNYAGIGRARDALKNLKERKELQGKKEKTEAEKKQLAAWDNLEGQLSRLRELMVAIDSGNRVQLAEFNRNKATLENEARSARAELEALNKSKSLGASVEITEELVTNLAAEDKARDQEVAEAEAAARAAAKAESDRQSNFESVAKRLGSLAAKQKKNTETLAKEGLGAEEKLLLQTERRLNECEIEIVGLQRDHHSAFLAVDKASRARAQARKDRAQAGKQLASAKLKLARDELARIVAKKAKEDREAAKKLREEAKRAEEESKTRAAVLSLEAFLKDLESLAKKESNQFEDVKKKTGLLEDTKESIAARKTDIEDLLPEDVQLDAFKEGYLRDQITWVQRSLSKSRSIRAEYLGQLEELKGRISSIRFDLKALRRYIDDPGSTVLRDLEERRKSKTNEGDRAEEARDKITTFLEIRRSWNRSRKDVQDIDINAISDPLIRMNMEREKSMLPGRTKAWDETYSKIKAIVESRIDNLDKTYMVAKECLTRVDEPVTQLEDIQQYLTNKAFWLKEDPPFGEKRRLKMEEQLSSLRKEIGSVINEALDDFISRIPGVRGVSGSLLIAAGILLFIYRRSRQKAIEGARAAFARTEDPLYRLLSMTGWLILEIGHQLLAIAGIMLVYGAFMPDNPVAGMILLIITVAAVRLALLRALLYAEVSDQDTSKLLFIDARKVIKLALTGLFIVVPPIAFFEISNRPALGQASRMVATCWIFLLAVKLSFRRDIILLLIPSKDIGALSRGLKLLIRYFWPLLTLFIAVIIYLKAVGYRTASEELATRSILGGGVLLAALVTYQFLQAYIDSKTISITSSKDGHDKGHSETKDEKRYHATVRRVFALPLLFVTIMGTILAMSWAMGITWAQWQSWGQITVIDAVTKTTEDGKIDTIVPAFELSNIGWALFTLALGYVIGGTIRDVIVIGAKPESSEERRGTRYALGTLIFYIGMTVTLILSLSSLRINLADYGWLLGTAGVALGFGMTEILSNFVCGIILFIERPVQVGDIVTVGDVEGDVRRISIRSTIVQTRDGVSIILPNRRLIETDVINWSHSDPLTRLRINVGTAYGSDVALVKKTMMEVATREGRVLKRPAPEVAFTQFGESELSFQLLCWLPTPDITVHRRVQSDLNSAIDAAFRRCGIEIPFPQRDLHLKTTPETMRESAAELATEEQTAEKDASKPPRKGKGSPLP